MAGTVAGTVRELWWELLLPVPDQQFVGFRCQTPQTPPQLEEFDVCLEHGSSARWETLAFPLRFHHVCKIQEVNS